MYFISSFHYTTQDSGHNKKFRQQNIFHLLHWTFCLTLALCYSILFSYSLKWNFHLLLAAPYISLYYYVFTHISLAAASAPNPIEFNFRIWFSIFLYIFLLFFSIHAISYNAFLSILIQVWPKTNICIERK